jgi:hypothetical protein
MFAGPLTFALFFITTSLCISFILPKENSQEDLIEAPDSRFEKTIESNAFLQISGLQDVSFSNTTTKSTVIPITDAINKDSLNKQVLLFSKQEDEGLQYYRQLSSRVAVIEFYSEVTGDRNVAIAILEYANKYNIPVSLAFALAYSESEYNCKAVNRNTNNSIDRGLFQLNNKSFPYIKEASFFDPTTSAKHGLAFLRYCLNTAGNEIGALAMYNAGPTSVKTNRTPQQTLNHIANITAYQKGLDELFDKEITSFIKLATQPLIAMNLNK